MSASRVPVYRGKRLDKRTRLKILKGTRQLIVTPGVWCRKAYRQKTEEGTTQYCLVGALNHVGNQILGLPDDNLTDKELGNVISLRDLAKDKGFAYIEDLNDAYRSKNRLALGKNVDGVLAFLDEKIAMEEGK